MRVGRRTRQVGPGAERGWGTGHDHRADVGVGLDPRHGRDDLTDQVRAQGVAPFGIVEGVWSVVALRRWWSVRNPARLPDDIRPKAR